MNLTIRPLVESDIDGAVHCIQRAFANDPYANWVFDRSRFSATRNHASLRARCLWGIRNAMFHVAVDNSPAATGQTAKDGVLGVAMWLPPSLARPAPSPPATWAAYLAGWLRLRAWREWAADRWSAWSLWLAQLAMNLRHGRGGLRVDRYWIWKAQQAAAQAELWDDPRGYYFCNIVTVLPEAQGRKVGKALMEGVLSRADREGRRCYLESSRDEPNVKIYERMGFELKREFKCKDGESDEGVTLYCMMREPKNA